MKKTALLLGLSVCAFLLYSCSADDLEQETLGSGAATPSRIESVQENKDIENSSTTPATDLPTIDDTLNGRTNVLEDSGGNGGAANLPPTKK